MSLFSVNAILIISTDDSSRILTKYYSPPHIPHNAQGNNYPGANPYPTLKDQKAFDEHCAMPYIKHFFDDVRPPLVEDFAVKLYQEILP